MLRKCGFIFAISILFFSFASLCLAIAADEAAKPKSASKSAAVSKGSAIASPKGAKNGKGGIVIMTLGQKGKDEASSQKKPGYVIKKAVVK